MFTDIEIHRAAKLYVPQCRRSAVAGARSSLYRGLDSIRELRLEGSEVVMRVSVPRCDVSLFSPPPQTFRFAW